MRRSAARCRRHCQFHTQVRRGWTISKEPYDYEEYWRAAHETCRGTHSAVGHGHLGRGFNAATYELRLKAADDLLARVLGKAPISLLEGAVGIGAYSPLWSRIGVARWTGIDISSTAVEDLSRKQPIGEFLVRDMATPGLAATLPQASYELVTAIDVLFHLVDDKSFRAALGNLAACVAVGGHLLVSDVFLEQSRQTAPHVRHRSLSDLTSELPRDFELVGRQQVFSILDDPIPRNGFHPGDQLMRLAWRGISATIQMCPERRRDEVGAGLVRTLAPLDAALSRHGVGPGTNLEFAIFRRSWGSLGP